MSQQLSEVLQQQVENLEIKLAFQEDTLDAMEKTLAHQQMKIQSLERKLDLLSDFLKAMRSEQAAVKPFEEETPPPHY